VLVVGDASHVIELSHQLRRDWYAGYQVVGACIPEALIAPVPQHLDGVPVVGSFRHILESAEAICADTVAVTRVGRADRPPAAPVGLADGGHRYQPGPRAPP